MYFIKLRNKLTEEERFILYYDKEKNKLELCENKSIAQCYLSIKILLEEIDYILNNNPNVLGEFNEIIIETGV